MKKFVFKLEKILSYREGIKDEKRKILKLKNQILQDEEEKLRELKEEVKNNTLQEDGIFNVEHLMLVKQYAVYLSEAIKKQLQVIEKAKENVEIAKNEYMLAMQDFETLKKLKEKKETEYKKNLLNEEAKEIDSICVQRFRVSEI